MLESHFDTKGIHVEEGGTAVKRILSLVGATLFSLAVAVPAWAGHKTYKGFNTANVTINGKPLVSDVPAIVVDGRTFLPVRAVGEALGVNVEWDASTETVIILGKSGLTTDIQTMARENATLRSEVAALRTVNQAPKQAQSNPQNVSERTTERTEITQQPVEGFRGVRWGSSADAIRSTESLPFNREELSGKHRKFLGYEGQLAGMSVEVGYGLYDNVLVDGIYMIKERHINPNDYIADFERLKTLLTNKYGNPTLAKMTWKNELLKDQPGLYGIAVGSGHLIFGALWQTPESQIFLVLQGDNFQPELTLLYSSLDYAHLAEQPDLNGL